MDQTGFIDLDPDPLRQFGAWLAEAQASGLHEPTAMALATAGADGRPTVRMVLLRGWDERGFCFYTNHESDKGLDLAANPRAALVFYWDPHARQVRLEGTVERMSGAESEAYFASRPRGSQLAAWTSEQSRPIASRGALEARYAEVRARFSDRIVPLPDYWGGYRVVPMRYEFWHSRPDRLHDRLRYSRGPDGAWVRQRLAP